MTSPLVPATVDLRDFHYMPLDVRRLLTSETWIDAADMPRVAHASMCLWCESWHQVPASSLPDNDRVLARLSMCDAKTWARIKDAVLAGWVKCDDGLLYHPVVAVKALESWAAKLAQRARTRAATKAREAKRVAQQNQHDEQRNDARDEQRDVERNDLRHVDQGKGREGNKEQEQKPISPAHPENHNPTEAGRACLLMRDSGCGLSTNPTHPDLLAALAEGVTPETLAATVAEGLARTPAIRAPFTWAIATARSRHADGPQHVKPNGASHAQPPRLSPIERVRAAAAASAGKRPDA